MYCAFLDTGFCVFGTEEELEELDELFDEELFSGELESSEFSDPSSEESESRSSSSVSVATEEEADSLLQERSRKVGLRKQSANTSASKEVIFFIILSKWQLPKKRCYHYNRIFSLGQ